MDDNARRRQAAQTVDQHWPWTDAAYRRFPELRDEREAAERREVARLEREESQRAGPYVPRHVEPRAGAAIPGHACRLEITVARTGERIVECHGCGRVER